MARLCIRIAPNDHPTDARLTPLRTQPGDVVEICEDGHVWRPGELNSGQYRFIDVPGVLAADLQHLKDPVTDVNRRMTQRRGLTLDVAALNAGPWRTRTAATVAQVEAITITATRLASLTRVRQ